jgi:RNA polymerase sigma-70 factor (ECF subfamily)
MRRELIDLARSYYGPEGLGAHHSTGLPNHDPSDPSTGPGEPAETTFDPSRLAAWTEFHRRIEELPEDDRMVFDLLWYQGLSQPEAAQVLGVAERTVNRRWLAARLKLGEALGGQLPF